MAIEPDGGSSARRLALRWVVAAAVALIVAIVVVDIAIGEEAVLAPAVLVGPFLVAVLGRGRSTALVGAVAVVGCCVSVFAQDLSSAQRVADIIVVLVGAVVATIVAVARERRDLELVRVQPEIDVAQRLRLALDAGRMGTWSWDIPSNRVDWDDALSELFGMVPGSFEKTFDAWLSHVHPDDRERARSTVAAAVESGGKFRFDHRSVWADGSVHWLEGRGETVLDEADNVVGAVGIAIDIDDRRRADLERMTLLASEQRGREDAERSMAALARLQQVTFGLSGATTVDEIARMILDRSMNALGASTGYFAVLDSENQALVLRAQVGYPEDLIKHYRTVDVGAQLPAPEVLRTGEPMFIESQDDGAAKYPHFPRDEMHGAFVVYPLLLAGEPGAVLALGFEHPRRFDIDARSFMRAVVESCAQALQRAQLYEAENTSRNRLRTLLEASERLAALDDPEAQLVVATEIASTRIGRWATIQIVEPDGSMRRSAVVHTDPSRAGFLHQLLELHVDGGEVIRQVVETREPFVMPDALSFITEWTEDSDVRSLIEALQWRSGLVVPMIVGARCIGALSIGDDRPRRLGVSDIELATDLARRTASAYERARLLRADQARTAAALRASEEKLAAEHRLVEVLQRTILPEELPVLPGIDIAASYQPAETGVEVGGDWYDIFPDGRDGDGVVIVVGDVAGHGIEAATLMGRVRNAARALAIEDPDPAAILRRVDFVLRTLEIDAFATAIAAHYSPATRTFTWARAGHPPPLLCSDTRSEYLEQTGGTPLGSMVSNYQVATRRLEPGDLLLLFTDGLVERRAHAIDEGLTWLADRVCSRQEPDLATLCSSLIKERFGDQPSDDDICVFALRTHTTDAPRPS